MIAFLEGQIATKEDKGVILVVGGIGYFVHTTERVKDQLEVETTGRLFICEHIKEDQYDLYGFLDVGAKQLFETLRTVNGVGSKMALNLMAIGELNQLRTAIVTGDSKYLSLADGVGRRLAERISLELKDKLAHFADASLTLSAGSDDAVVALSSLGLSEAEARDALRGVDPNLAVEERIKLALQKNTV